MTHLLRSYDAYQFQKHVTVSRPCAAQRTSNNLTQPVTATRRYWTELCFIKLPTIARNTSGLSLATFWNSASSECQQRTFVDEMLASSHTDMTGAA